jgi:acyl carrier protein
MMTAADVLMRTEQYVRDNFLYARPDFVLEPEHPLIAGRVVDSMGLMELIAFIDEEFGVNVEDEDITEQNLGTLAAITRYVTSRLVPQEEYIQVNAA